MDILPVERAVPPSPARRFTDFRAALRDSKSVGLALFPIGAAFGLLVAHAGLAWWWAPTFATVVYAGSLEFLLIGLVLAATPLAQIALTAFVVNFRHVFYALSFPLHRLGRLGKVYGTYALTDETYALTTSSVAKSWSGARILWLQVQCQVYWVGGAGFGAVFGTLLPLRLDGLDFALTALFVVLVMDAFRERQSVPVPVLALICALVGMVLFPAQMLLVSLGLFTACLLVAYCWKLRSARA